MPLSDITRFDVIKAIQEYDAMGADSFLDKYGFGRSRSYRLVFEGKLYPSKAIVGAAHLHATGTAWTAENFSGGAATEGRVLNNLGFDVEVDGQLHGVDSVIGQRVRISPAAGTHTRKTGKLSINSGKQDIVTAKKQSTKSQIKAEELQVRKIFSSDYSFRIPDYQRPYAWRQEEAVQLLEDLDFSMRDGSDEPYFLGSLVLAKPIESPIADVVDGQQRLTTLTILMAILRDLSNNTKVKSELESLINEPGEYLADIPSKPRLELRPKDNEFFNKFVQTSDNIPSLLTQDPAQLHTDAQRNILKNTKVLYERLVEWSELDRHTLAKLVSTQTYLVIVTTEDLASAYRIFSVMNARGLDLQPTDIFKSTIIGAIPDLLRAEYREKWETAEDNLTRTNFPELFSHIRMIHAKERPRKELLKEFPEQVLNQFLPKKAMNFIDDVLWPYADAYGKIINQDYVSTGGAEMVNNWLKRLAQVDNTDWRPPALWAMRYRPDDPDFLNSFFKKLERLAASMLIRRVYATPRSTRYAELLKQLERGSGLDSSSFELGREEKTETRKMLNGEIYKVAPVRKYVLLRLDEELASAPGVNYDHKIITVEHVLPQHPAANSGWLRVFSAEEREYWTHRIANLVLLNRSKNSEAQNYSFKEKKSKYFASKKGVTTFSLTSKVLHDTEWTPQVLTQRQQELLGILHRTWAL